MQFIEYNDSNSYDMYLYTRKEILKRKTMPFEMSNEALADYYFMRFKSDYPTARLIKCTGRQYICFDRRAIKKVQKQLNEEFDRLIQKEDELRKIISSEFA